MPFFWKFALKNTLIPPISRIGTGLKLDFIFQKNLGGFFRRKLFKNDEECFLFHLKKSFWS